MRGFLDSWIEAMRFACETQSVVALRLARIAEGGPLAEAETRRMIAEKTDALIDAEVAALNALADGEGLLTAAERAYGPVRRRVHANSRRLLRAAR